MLKCEAEPGICQRCYGVAPATGKVVDDRRRGGHHRRPVHRRARHAADAADVPHRWRRRARTSRTASRASSSCSRPASRRASRSWPRWTGKVTIEDTEKARKVDDHRRRQARSTRYTFPRRTRLFVRAGRTRSRPARSSTRGRSTRTSCSRSAGGPTTELYLVQEVQKVYKSQGVDINDKHIEIIVRQMMKKVRVEQKGDTTYLPGQFVDRHELLARERARQGPRAASPRSSPRSSSGSRRPRSPTDSFLSAASFQETTKVLTDAALEGKTDRLLGLKENVIIGKLIPAATGLRRYRRLEIEPTEPVPAAERRGDRPARRGRARRRARAHRRRRARGVRRSGTATVMRRRSRSLRTSVRRGGTTTGSS